MGAVREEGKGQFGVATAKEAQAGAARPLSRTFSAEANT